jgi:hypothetical protein
MGAKFCAEVARRGRLRGARTATCYSTTWSARAGSVAGTVMPGERSARVRGSRSFCPLNSLMRSARCEKCRACFAGSLRTAPLRARGASPGDPQPSMSAPNKCLARTNKSHARAEPTKKRRRQRRRNSSCPSAKLASLVSGSALPVFHRPLAAPNREESAWQKSASIATNRQ